MAKDAFENWLESIPPLGGISSEQYDGLMQLCVDNSPLWALLGLLLGQRQDQMQILAAMPLGNSADAARASVIQGHIRGLDAARQTLLGLAKRAAEKQPQA